MTDFLPVSVKDMQKRGWERPDFVYVIGDAYVDHPSFGPAIISRLLEAYGFKVCIISQPDWKQKDSIAVFGEPRLGFLVSAGNMDSMVNHYSVSKKRRSEDLYSPGGKMGLRPDRACVVYGNLIRQTYKTTPIILGGIEASLRRMAHYDYWSDSLKRSVLLDSGADLISYGMGEHSIVEIAQALDSGIAISDLTFVAGTVYKTRVLPEEAIQLPGFEEMQADKYRYADSFAIQHENTDPFSGKQLCEAYPHQVYVVQNPPAKPLTMQEMDDVYALPYVRDIHPMYRAMGGIPAIKEVKFSLISNRGCFGGCNFCALTFHQGRIVQVRSHESLIQEAKQMTMDPEFKGYIHDVGGPTANFRHPSCKKQMTKGVCKNRQCLFPTPCKNLDTDHSDYIALLRKLRSIPKVKKVFIRSGIRFDYLLAEGKGQFLEELVRYHVSGQLKVAPEHVADPVLTRMGKPPKAVYLKFTEKYKKMNEKCGMDQYLVPYLMSSHPGSSMKEAVELAIYLKGLGYMPEQVQDFYPTPSTVSTCMYYTGIIPGTRQKVYVPRNPHEKAMQRALIQYRNPANRALVEEALRMAGRMDLIGFGPDCLLRPERKGAEKRNPKAGSGRDGRRDADRKSRSGVGRGSEAGKKPADRKYQEKPSRNRGKGR